ncbi:MAG TPA: hypothetical protein VGJ58_02280 [Gaiellaceae bacterium]|jgi:hypothetical protein
MSGVERKREEMIARARERAETPATPGEWGYTILGSEHDEFVGRFRGRTTDPENNREILLFWDEAGQLCFSRYYTALDRELNRAQPEVGDRVYIYRGANYKTSYDEAGEPKGRSFGVEVEPSSEPVPEAGASEDDLPF